MKNKNKAFSLIELSIVILIIGILVAGVTQSSRLVRQMKISSARSLTVSSPVLAIKDLYSWHETILENSFDSNDASDGTNITNWYDLNSQSSDKINMNQTNNSMKPTYVASGINGLPVISFDGTADKMNSIINVPAITSQGSSTLFFVINNKDVASGSWNQRYIVYQPQANCANNIEIGHTWNSGAFGIHAGCGYTSQTNSVISTINPTIMSLVLLKSPLTFNLTDNVKIYRNGASVTLSAAGSGAYNQGLGGSYAKSNSILYFGSRDTDAFYPGLIGEIIIYSRSLNDEERRDVEKYLSKKWGIAVQ